VFMKKYDEDLNTTLIFVSLAYRTDARPLSWTTGWPLFRRDLCSAVTSAFIILVHSEFQPDPNEETNALLRVIIHLRR